MTTLSPAWQAFLILAFGAVTSGLIVALATDERSAIDLLLLSASLGALATAGLWLWILATRHGTGWAVAFSLAIWIPYVNFVVASIFARRYWSEGARAPALLALAGIFGQTLATLRMLAPGLTPPV
jgi:hypothetical protein